MERHRGHWCALVVVAGKCLCQLRCWAKGMEVFLQETTGSSAFLPISPSPFTLSLQP